VKNNNQKQQHPVIEARIHEIKGVPADFGPPLISAEIETLARSGSDKVVLISTTSSEVLDWADAEPLLIDKEVSEDVLDDIGNFALPEIDDALVGILILLIPLFLRC